MKYFILLLTLSNFNSYGQYKTVDYRFERLLSPDINKESFSNIGESLILNKHFLVKDAIEVIEVPDFKIYSARHLMKKGDILPLEIIGNQEFFYSDPKKAFVNDQRIGIMYDELHNEYNGFYSNNSTFGGIGIKIKRVKGIEVKKSLYINPDCKTCSAYEFIYTGKKGDVLKFTYREFINDLARPAFSQQLEYDLNDGNIVGFKNLKIKILEANNLEIKYEILNHLK